MSDAMGLETNGIGQQFTGHLNLSKTLTDAGWHYMVSPNHGRRIERDERAAAKARPRILGCPEGWRAAK